MTSSSLLRSWVYEQMAALIVPSWEPFINGQAAPFDPKYYCNWEEKPGSETPAAMMKRKREEAKRIGEKNASAQNLA
ncbi:hypothetical protein RHSIM_Rhsim11G0097200 [Rhododendron simsii]|uniref:Uncharacterized protein n=1 Tax=Rhododendron simsii TaxID=118357 RepID=A0A834LBX1_RHOSS|nr:hypothetical protein RHSIM_Rhsim11G0097200 [Rhododendron simsii]